MAAARTRGSPAVTAGRSRGSTVALPRLPSAASASRLLIRAAGARGRHQHQPLDRRGLGGVLGAAGARDRSGQEQRRGGQVRDRARWSSSATCSIIAGVGRLTRPSDATASARTWGGRRPSRARRHSASCAAGVPARGQRVDDHLRRLAAMDERQRRAHGRVILAKRGLDARGQPVALVPGGDRRQQLVDVLLARRRRGHPGRGRFGARAVGGANVGLQVRGSRVARPGRQRQQGGQSEAESRARRSTRACKHARNRPAARKFARARRQETAGRASGFSADAGELGLQQRLEVGRAGAVERNVQPQQRGRPVRELARAAGDLRAGRSTRSPPARRRRARRCRPAAPRTAGSNRATGLPSCSGKPSRSAGRNRRSPRPRPASSGRRAAPRSACRRARAGAPRTRCAWAAGPSWETRPSGRGAAFRERWPSPSP